MCINVGIQAQISICNMKSHSNSCEFSGDWLIKTIKSKLSITIIVFLLIFGCSKGLSRCLNWTGVFLVIIAVWIVKIISDATFDIFWLFYKTIGVERNFSRSSSPFCFWALYKCSSQCLATTYSRVWNVHLERDKISNFWTSACLISGLTNSFRTCLGPSKMLWNVYDIMYWAL